MGKAGDEEMTEQKRRGKAIKGLEHELQNRGKCGHYCRDGKETVSCEYDKDGLCIQHWGNDALALLKVQEPKYPIKKQSKHGWFSYCPKCGIILNEMARPKYCSECGQAVKWIG